jgi:O-acetylserine/cysteine efflux transporter
MPVSHLALALAVVAVWGTNFVVIKWGLAELPPFLLAALRFAMSSLPFMFLIRRPATPWWRLAAFGVLLGAGQFGLLFLAMKADISPGLASLVVQAQVFFTIALAGQQLKLAQAAALMLAVAGMGWIGWQAAQGGAGISPSGLFLVLGAALCWALANAVARGAGRVDALVLSGPACSRRRRWPAVGGLRWRPAGAWRSRRGEPGRLGRGGLAGGGQHLVRLRCLNWLLARHPPATVTPAALLVPVFGMGASALAFGETLPAWKLGAAGLVMAGLALNLWAATR